MNYSLETRVYLRGAKLFTYWRCIPVAYVGRIQLPFWDARRKRGTAERKKENTWKNMCGEAVHKVNHKNAEECSYKSNTYYFIRQQSLLQDFCSRGSKTMNQSIGGGDQCQAMTYSKIELKRLNQVASFWRRRWWWWWWCFWKEIKTRTKMIK